MCHPAIAGCEDGHRVNHHSWCYVVRPLKTIQQVDALLVIATEGLLSQLYNSITAQAGSALVGSGARLKKILPLKTLQQLSIHASINIRLKCQRKDRVFQSSSRSYKRSQD